MSKKEIYKNNTNRNLFFTLFFLITLNVGFSIYLFYQMNENHNINLVQDEYIINQTNSKFEKTNIYLENLINNINSKFNLIQDDVSSKFSQVSENVNTLTKKNEELSDSLDKVSIQSQDFSRLINELKKSVLYIQSYKQGSKTGSVGTGFFIHKDGYIITNFHVINDEDNIIEVFDYKKNGYRAQLIDYKSRWDLALLKINKETDEYLEFETNRKIAVGDKVIAIGNPSGLDYSVTEGIISAKNRELDNQPRDLEFIQTDVAINYGNSGGPLINLNKKVVGVNTLIIANTQGLGFAVSNDNTEEFIDNIFTQLNVTR